ncbi:DUF6383 domain-containing protein [Parabacteroides sp. GYB001]|uniref:DUF6383 domain-containing protein n=1 Tax=Parabacteroides leei TaxID=2939491 RepID=UPI00201754E8|nr:DUF6383 domain-containing protein [Parabacteroides leei]MCL3850746.1 DUF6383 domain-containing protein [Parabacteroides leei]
MNKKFSTFLAGAALLSAMSASAGTDVTALPTDYGKKLFQLEANGSYLSMTNTGALKLESAVTSANLASTLWCVEVTEQGLGKAPIYDFTNKLTGQRLDIQYDGTSLVTLAKETATTDSTYVGGEISGWAFSTQYLTGLTPGTLYSYFKADSVIGLVKDASNDAVRLMKLGANDAAADATIGAKLTLFTLQTADAIVLSANEINTILGVQEADKGVKLTFTPDEMGEKLPVPNPFTNGKFTAETSTDANFVFVKNADKKYLRVDTAYTNASGSKFLAFNWIDKVVKTGETAEVDADATTIENSDLKDQYKFAFTYFPSIDSLVIQVKSVVRKPEGTDTWKDALGTAGNITTADLTNLATTAKNYVTVQDLIAGKVRIITIADKKESDVKLGYEGCNLVANGKTSVADGLYFIKNSKGQYLAAPIHLNGTIAWTTVKESEQMPAHMPAYQWVVLKKNTGDKVSATSPVAITNREFNTNTVETQLSAAEGSSVYASAVALFGTAADSLTFEKVDAVKYPEAYSDSTLGYKNIPDAKYNLNVYTFNYLHPYATDKFIAKPAKDSVLTVLEGKTAFTLNEGGQYAYGYLVDKVAKERIGLAQLYRTSYKVALDGKYLGEAAEQKYAIGAFTAPVDSFYFKENNHVDAADYYAIVKANDNAVGTHKAGVTDDDLAATLKVQVLAESRTSSFAIDQDNTPLYRRFNSAKLEGNAGDATDTLRFYENYRNEYLQIEGNDNFIVKGIDFLGIYTSDKAPSGLSFVVDTAWVNRGQGYIKPQYLISIERRDQAAIPGQPCPEAGPHVDANGNITDAEHCVHAIPAIPGFERGKYLVNFADSAAYATNSDDYKWKGYTRAGFVDAIRVQDTLYILKDEFAGIANNKVNFAAIKAADAKQPVGKKYIHYLNNDNHKLVTWSMRFMDTKVAANEVEADRSFLFESMAAANEPVIAPKKAAWLKMQNGCLVLSNEAESSFDDIKTGGDDALIFNVKHVANDEIATDTEEVGVNTVSVIAGNGTVTIKGAANKTVTIANVLGQTIANTVLSSDDATISAPAGVVVVAVEGEAAVKAIVK